MKKFGLTIPKPCHENWDAMTQEDKGRFCGACQKTVTDFTAMSDREIAQFFKKPVGSVCGRFHQDQLHRKIEFPRKRISWVKYFFTIALPTFLFSIKANSQKVTMGKPSVKRAQLLEETTMIAHPLRQEEKQQLQKSFLKNSHQHYKIEPIKSDGLSFSNPPCAIQPKEISIKKELVYDLTQSVSILMGGVSSRPFVVKKQNHLESAVIKNTELAPSKFLVYPNPAKVNSTLTIDLKNIDAGNYIFSIINSDGRVVQLEKIAVEKKVTQENLTLKNIPAGPYFIRLSNNNNNNTHTEIIVVH